MNNHDSLQIAKPLTFKYTIRISKADIDYYQIKRELSRSFSNYFNNYYRPKDIEEYTTTNIPYIVLNDLFQKRFALAGDMNAYLTDYSENNGSLIISFTILIVGTITNYGSIRETIDYFAEDIEKLFSNALNNRYDGYAVTSSIQYQNIPTPQITMPHDANQYNVLLAKIRVDRILIGIVFFVLILSILQNYLSTPSDSKQSNIDDVKVKSIVQEELRNQKINELLQTKSDTVYIQKK